MPKLWNKGKDDKEVEDFTVGDDHFLDQELLQYDLIASSAHAKALRKAKLISEEELKKLLTGLRQIGEAAENGQFTILKEDEDCHTAIENFLTKRFGDAGKKIHTGRSRNDQALTAIRLYEKDSLLKAADATLNLANELITFSKRHSTTIMPGYTHMRQAMPSSFGLWAEAFVEILINEMTTIKSAYKRINSNPLGSAASYGTDLPIDREYTSKLLGFSNVPNPLAAANSRGKDEAMLISVMHQIMLSLSRMATDLMLFSTEEFGYVQLPEELCTGSSMMPQKKNPDVLELTRAKTAVVQGHYVTVSSIVKDLPSGYNRDLQLTKRPVMESFDITLSSLAIMKRIVKELKVNNKRCLSACSPGLWATEEADKLVKGGMPFRQAYKEVASRLDKLKRPAKPIVPKLKSRRLIELLGEERRLLVGEQEKLQGKLRF
ncbi:MAG: argininosuccinate lyase [Nanoarchaeota archaeon]|nr:argininosuccinate lyase [Nanoarchaeota archaeon]